MKSACLAAIVCVVTAIPALGQSATPRVVSYDLSGLPPLPRAKTETYESSWQQWASAIAAVPRSAVELRGNTLSIRAPGSHELLQQALASIRKQGHRQILVECRIMGISEEVKVEANNGRQFFPPGPRRYVFPGVDAAELPATRDAQTITRTRRPFARQLITDDQARRLVQATSRNPDSNILSAPKVVLFSGQDATIEMGSQRPFVVGLKFHRQAVEPQIRTETEGTTIECFAAVIGENKARLRTEVRHRTINGVTTETVGNLNGRALTVQIPEVQLQTLRAVADIEIGQSLLIGGTLMPPEPETPKRGIQLLSLRRETPVRMRRWILLTPRIVENAPPATTESK